MSRIAIFSKYFGYNVGGAERSMLAMMQRLESEGHEIVAYVHGSPKHYGARERPLVLPSSWDIRPFSLPVDWTRFRFVEYLANYRALQSLVSSMSDIDSLYAYGHMAPAVLSGFKGGRVYLARDEYALGWNRNYHTGFRALMQEGYILLEAPFRWKWMRDLKRVAATAELVANSRFIAKGLKALAPDAAVSIVPPQLDFAALKAEYDSASFREPIAPGIVAVGDNVLKGGDIVRRVAALMPERQFYLFDRQYSRPITSANLTCMPWQSSPGALYRYAELVMVPSRINEAMPRVVLEAQVLGLPVVASNRGGSPEAIADRSLLVDEVDNQDEWVRKIRQATAPQSLPDRDP